MPINVEAISELMRKHPNHYIYRGKVYGVPLIMFYIIYPGDDPTSPYPYIEDSFIVTEEGIPANWVPEDEIKHMEDNIFAAHSKRGKGFAW